MKRMKKVLSIVLSLAMILTSITVYNTKTAKAAEYDFSIGEIERIDTDDNNCWAFFKWHKDVQPTATVYKVYDLAKSSTEPILTNSGDWAQTALEFGETYNFRVDACDGDEVLQSEEFTWKWPDNFNFNINATVGKEISIKWSRITGAVSYSLYDGDTLIASDIWTGKPKESYKITPVAGTTYNFIVKAYDESGNPISENISNDAVSVTVDADEDAKEQVTQDPITLTGDEVWTAFDRKTKNNNATVYVEETALSGILSDSRIRGPYDKASDPEKWNNIEDTVIGDQPVFGFLKATTDLTIVDETGVGYRYTDTTKKTNTEVWRGGGDCNYISQTLIDAKPGETKLFRVTLTSGDSFLIKVVGEESEQYAATVDGEELNVTNNTVTLPTTAEYGYYCNGKMYKKGADVTLEEDMAFTSVNKLDLTITNGVSIRLVTGETGLRYKATITSDNNKAINSDAIQEGILITTQANYNGSDSNIEIGSDNVLKVANVSETDDKWYAEKNDTTNNEYGGTFCGSIIKMIDSNIPRPFVARAYATIKYEGDSEATVIKYTDVIGKKSIQDIAKLIQTGTRYNTEDGYTSDQKQIIDGFANYTDAQ